MNDQKKAPAPVLARGPLADRDGLVEIRTVQAAPDASHEEQVRDYLRQIKNPYCYLDQGFVVSCSFAGEQSFEDCMAGYIQKKFGVTV